LVVAWFGGCHEQNAQAMDIQAGPEGMLSFFADAKVFEATSTMDFIRVPNFTLRNISTIRPYTKGLIQYFVCLFDRCQI
jgi:hypothetical protein